jgi:hypothetical protein
MESTRQELPARFIDHPPDVVRAARLRPPTVHCRDDLRCDGHRLGIESNARHIAGDGPPVRRTERDRDGLSWSDRHDADGRGRPVGPGAGLLEHDGLPVADGQKTTLRPVCPETRRLGHGLGR